jgi:hypothetical protein
LLLVEGFLVLDVESSDAPVLNRVFHLEFEVLHFWEHRDNGTPDIMNFFIRGILVEEENLLPQALVGIDSQESFK